MLTGCGPLQCFVNYIEDVKSVGATPTPTSMRRRIFSLHDESEHEPSPRIVLVQYFDEENAGYTVGEKRLKLKKRPIAKPHLPAKLAAKATKRPKPEPADEPGEEPPLVPEQSVRVRWTEQRDAILRALCRRYA